MKLKERWDDGAYLTRIIFNALQGEDRGTTGFGISTSIQDNEYDIVVVDCEKQEIRITEEGEDCDLAEVVKTYTFNEFCVAVFKEEEEEE